MAWVRICDECGAPARGTIELFGGRAEFGGRSRTSADLCHEHWPEPPWELHNCKRVVFHWSDEPRTWVAVDDSEDERGGIIVTARTGRLVEG